MDSVTGRILLQVGKRLEYAEEESGGRERIAIVDTASVPCKEWLGASDTSLYSMALHPSIIGDTTTQKRCTIIDARNCATMFSIAMMVA